MRRLAWLLLLPTAALVNSCAVPPPTARPDARVEARAPVTILISIDGMRPDLLGRGLTPNLDALAASGVSAVMRPSFPTKTFPNHYTLVTGMTPDRHGVVDNYFEDPRKPGERFAYNDAKASADPFWWDEAEPVWVTAERAGVRTGTMFWPGSERAIRGVRPSDWLRFDDNITNAQRTRTVIDWMRRPAATRPGLVTLYFESVDVAAHNGGPESPTEAAAVGEVDAQVGELVTALRDMGQPANIVVVSDHGMSPVSKSRVVQIADMVDPNAVRLITDGPYAAIEPVAGREAEVARGLLRPRAHVTCWRKSEIPVRFRYGRNPRVARFLCLADEGWMVLDGAWKWTQDNRGEHGFDNELPGQQAVFIASGPGIRAAGRMQRFDNVEVYPLVARLAGVVPLASDARGTVARSLLMAVPRDGDSR